MSRIPLLTDEEVSPSIRELWDKAPVVLNINRAVAHAETAYRSCMSLGSRLLLKAELPARLRELAILRIAHVNGAAYEWEHHARLAAQLGIPGEAIRGVRAWEDARCFSDLDRIVLRFTDELLTEKKAAEKTFEQLRAHLPHRQIVELILSVGYWNLIALMIVNADFELEDTP